MFKVRLQSFLFIVQDSLFYPASPFFSLQNPIQPSFYWSIPYDLPLNHRAALFLSSSKWHIFILPYISTILRSAFDNVFCLYLYTWNLPQGNEGHIENRPSKKYHQHSNRKREPTNRPEMSRDFIPSRSGVGGVGGCLTADNDRFDSKSIFVWTSLLNCSDPRLVTTDQKGEADDHEPRLRRYPNNDDDHER